MSIVEDKIEEAFSSLDKINEVKVSSTFKSRVLEEIQQAKEQKETYSWFTPKLQIAAMIIVLLVNTIAIAHLFSDRDTTSFENFVEQYDLNSNSFF